MICIKYKGEVTHSDRETKMTDILFEGMTLRRENLTKVRRQGNALFYRNKAGEWVFLYGYSSVADAKFARTYLAGKLKKHDL